MVTTPLGVIKIYIDGICTDYDVYKHEFNNPPCDTKPVSGCYRVEIATIGCHSIACILDPTELNILTTGDSGQDYMTTDFIKASNILTIGAEDDHPAFETVRIPFGLQYNLTTSIDKVLFGIAWATDYESADDVRTWYAADPTI